MNVNTFKLIRIQKCGERAKDPMGIHWERWGPMLVQFLGLPKKIFSTSSSSFSNTRTSTSPETTSRIAFPVVLFPRVIIEGSNRFLSKTKTISLSFPTVHITFFTISTCILWRRLNKFYGKWQRHICHLTFYQFNRLDGDVYFAENILCQITFECS